MKILGKYILNWEYWPVTIIHDEIAIKRNLNFSKICNTVNVWAINQNRIPQEYDFSNFTKYWLNNFKYEVHERELKILQDINHPFCLKFVDELKL